MLSSRRSFGAIAVFLLLVAAIPAFAQWSTNGASIVYYNGNVGVGTSVPNTTFEAVTTDATTGNGAVYPQFPILIRNKDNTLNNWRQIGFYGSDSLGLGAIGMQLKDTISHYGDMHIGTRGPDGFKTRLVVLNSGSIGVNLTAPSGKFNVRTGSQSGVYFTEVNSRAKLQATNGADPASATGPLLINSDGGNVGIGPGMSSPQYALDVAGTIHATDVIGANWQDVAEWVPSGTRLDPGTVVILDDREANRVKPSSRSYDTKVAGVVSAHPGIVLGVASETKSEIATTGRVRVRVDAAKHAIAIGDLLVTSDEAGTAMYSEPIDIGGVHIHRPGTIIGKALEPLAAGQGEILVLLSLQ